MSSERTRQLVSMLLEKLGLPATVEERSLPEVSIPHLNIVTDEPRLLIGSRGEHLWALEYLAKRILEKENPDERIGFLLDVNGYRLRKIEELKAEAKIIARKVRLYRRELPLKPMPAFERRIIHIALAAYPDIATESTGQGPSRRVVIKPYP